MKTPLMEKLTALKSGKYKDFRLKGMRLYAEQNRCVISLRYADSQSATSLKSDIEADIMPLLPVGVDYEFEYERVFTDDNHTKAMIVAFLKRHLQYDIKDTDIVLGEEAEIFLLEFLYRHAMDLSLQESLEAILSDELCRHINVVFKPADTHKSDYDNLFKELEKEPLDKKMPELDAEKDVNAERVIRVSKVERFIGDLISEPALYIKDVSPSQRSIVLCGKISKPDIRTGQKKSDPTKEYTLVKFDLSDFTGQVQCSAFTTVKTKPKYEKLEGGESIIALGRLEEGFNGGTPTFRPQDICFCELPKSFSEKIYKAPPPKEYSVLFPVDVVSKEQSDFFSSDNETHESVRGEYVVIDIETTGINSVADKITEIAAVKLVDGRVKQYITSLINPGVSIPENVVKLTGISNEMVKDKPSWHEIAPDIAKFCENVTLIGHNVTFDISFLNAAGYECHHFFNHDFIDTYALAREKIKDIKNYKLSTLVSYFGLENEDAHRALSDTIATAKLFVKLSKM